jgi:hypothetical protein
MLPEINDSLYVPIMKPGDFFAVRTLGGQLAFHQVGVDGDLKALGRGASPLPALLAAPERLTDSEGEPLTRETALELLRPGLTVRTYNVLKREQLNTVGDVIDAYLEHGMNWFYEMRNVGGKSADEISARLNEWSRAGMFEWAR